MAQQFQVAHLADIGAFPAKPLHLAIGMFDGVHLGHRSVVDAAIQSARRSGGVAGVLTFSPHPSRLFRPENPTRLIASPALRTRLLTAAGTDLVITQEFTPEFAKIEAVDFLPHLKRHLPKLCAVYVGENWRFGHARRGDVALLVNEGRKNNISVVSAPRINLNGEAISSTRIRDCLEAGRIEEANSLLGYTYFSEGVVIPGKSLGRDLGYPTLNVAWEPELLPKFGVYVVQVSGPKSAGKYSGVANYGLRPTVEQSNDPRIEVHVLGACPFAGSDFVKVEWLKFLRPEMKFGSVAELTAQIGTDRAAAEAYFRD
jgi:riboflavin kinase/FMN adenylyltransferase